MHQDSNDDHALRLINISIIDVIASLALLLLSSFCWKGTFMMTHGLLYGGYGVMVILLYLFLTAKSMVEAKVIAY